MPEGMENKSESSTLRPPTAMPAGWSLLRIATSATVCTLMLLGLCPYNTCLCSD